MIDKLLSIFRPAALVSGRVATPGPTISIINMTTILTDAQIATAVVDLQTQIDRDFTPVWNISANLYTVAKGGRSPAKNWVIAIMDTTDQAGMVGYHSVTGSDVPVGKVFAKTDMNYGIPWTVTLSHELLEMLVNPFIDATVFIQTSETTGKLYAYEVCDACENNFYNINNTVVSDFVYPTWFNPMMAPGSVKFDQMGAIKGPFQFGSGGYINSVDITTSSGWVNTFADKPSERFKRKGPDSRTFRITKRKFK